MTVKCKAMSPGTITWGQHRLHAEKQEVDYQTGKWVETKS